MTRRFGLAPVLPAPALLTLALVAVALPPRGARAQPAASESAITVGSPTPRWVEPLDVPATTPDGEGGYEDLLTQIALRPGPREGLRFVRRAYHVRNASGVQEASELEVAVAADETLAWHYARVRRGGGVTDRLHDAGQLRVIQPETRRDEGLYDESRHVVLTLEDVRAGDVIEYAYTIRRDLSLFGDRYIEHESFPVGYSRRVRLDATWPTSRPVRARLRAVDPTWVLRDEPGAVRIEAVATEPPAMVEDAPGWAPQRPAIELSEFGTWADVAAWAAEAYAPAAAEPTPAGVPLERFRAAGDGPRPARAALEFVQDEVRYLGLEMGEHALVPHLPSEVVARRFGDCKDKARLLVTILDALGVEAAVALVHTRRGRDLDEALPSPYAFNHAIVVAEIDGRSVWLDPTRAAERGPIGERPPVVFGRGLRIRPGASLEPIPVATPTEPLVDIEQRFDLMRNRPRMAIRTTYRGAEATDVRAALQAFGASEIGETSHEFLSERTGMTLSVADPLTVEDDEEHNVLRIVETYLVADFWGTAGADLTPWAVMSRLPSADAHRGDLPLAIDHPVFVRHRVEVRDPNGWQMRPGSTDLSALPLVIHRQVEVEDTRLAITVTLESRADHVPAAEVSAFARALDASATQLEYGVTNDPEHMAPEPTAAPSEVGFACVGVVLLLALGAGLRMAYLAWRRRTRRVRHQRAATPRPGESPETALEAADLEAARAAHRGFSCCGAALDPADWARARYGEETIAVASATCAECGERHRAHYRLGS